MTVLTTRPPAGGGRGVSVVRADGRLVRIRPAARADRSALLALHADASDRSNYLRFFTAGRGASAAYVDLLLGTREPDGQALVAVEGDALIGVAGWVREGADEAEVALLVSDARQRLGIGTLLLEHLAADARAHGVRRFVAETLAENVAMLRVFDDLGFAVTREVDQESVHVTCSVLPDESTIAAVDERERRAGVRSLAPVMAPRSVVVVGAGRRPGSVGNELLRCVTEAGFTGDVYAVGRADGDLHGVRVHHDVRDLPVAPDLAVVAVPAPAVPEALQACGERGVRAAVIVSAGFAETGADGAEAQAELVAIARHHGMRVVGPNCLGVLSTDPAVRLHAVPGRLPGLQGTLALGSQSGALGSALLHAAARAGVGVSSFVSVGNKADVSGNDLLLYWEQDQRTAVIGLYLESFGNPRKFARIARRVSRHKPVLALKSGRTAAGRRAGSSHTAAAAASDAVVDALFRQAGVLRMDTVEDLLDSARVLAGQPLPRGRRVAVLGNAGGPGVLAADAASAAGLAVAELSVDAQSRLLADVPKAVSTMNPVDLGAAASPAAVAAGLRALLRCDEVDAVLVVVAETLEHVTDDVTAAVAAAGAQADKPVLLVALAAPAGSIPLPDAGSGRFLPVFGFPEPAARALATAAAYADVRSRPVGRVRAPAVQAAPVRALVAAVLEECPDGRWLSPPEVEEVLAAYGILGCRQREAPAPESSVTVGAAQDPQFGPVVTAGRVGRLADRAFRLVPLTREDAARMLDELRPPGLPGDLDAPAVSRPALAALVCRVAALVDAHPEVAELDLGRVAHRGNDLVVGDAALRVAPARLPDVAVRRLQG
ncbi:bifunctional acetate--CoA ligase family protein/GNAT family N-acetyltransferase [Motilibacter aurantiacus]|uniref:bifunctional acetate--CoA ligase family protein/GNAT family N-acetyltransferase n=1 Tax=Motilibacter aurantiacus TaxID=2714955 RepID=UPI00140A89CC|nr:GNAT family N-acetyltransferase [Motilibacter aurantiacus]